MGKPKQFTYEIPDEDMFTAVAVHGENGRRIIRTMPFDNNTVVYLDARDVGFLIAAERMKFQIVGFWAEIATVALLDEIDQCPEYHAGMGKLEEEYERSQSTL